MSVSIAQAQYDRLHFVGGRATHEWITHTPTHTHIWKTDYSESSLHVIKMAQAFGIL